MPGSTTLRRLTSLKGLGVYREFTWTSEVPELRRWNLIYGFNGSGKTILSRVFASLAEGALHPKLPADGSFQVEFSDGSRVKSSDKWEAMGDRLLVFSRDFVESNIRWEEGTANPVFYLGKDQADSAKKLDAVNGNIAELRPRLASAVADIERKDRGFDQYKTDTARLVGQQLGMARTYRAPDLAHDYARGTYDESLRLSESEQAEEHAIILQDAPLPKCVALDASALNLEGVVRKVRDVLGLSLGTMVLADLRNHETMIRWVKEGLDYHRAQELASCLLCGNRLTAERIESLDAVIDERFDGLVKQVDSARSRVEAVRDRLNALPRNVPSENDIIKNLQGKRRGAAEALEESLGPAQAMVSSLLTALAEKATAPNVPVDTGGLPTTDSAEVQGQSIDDAISQLNQIISEHNAAHDAFEAVRGDAKQKLKGHHLAVGQSKYHELQSEVTGANDAVKELKRELQELEGEAKRLEEAMREHGPAAGMISDMVRSYLGHGEIEVASLENGYELRRGGKRVAEFLSEGEKTAIALCYFLSLLQAEGRQVRDLIVVVDDPISSLDTRALNYAFNMIRGAMGGAGQLIVMTHNLHFMNETKKWLKRLARPGDGSKEPEAALLFLDVVQVDADGTRSATIKELPKHIREYESEYHFLFHLVLKFANAREGEFGYQFLMPNALRKLLEVFLAFKLPGSDGLRSKVTRIAESEGRLDVNRLRALERLAQLESHADSLDDLVSFSSMTIEETRNATDALFHLMKTVDEKHYERLCRICRG